MGLCPRYFRRSCITPFLAGQLAQCWIGEWIGRHERIIGFVDRGSILLIVYSAFSEGVANGIWQQVNVRSLLMLGLVDLLLLEPVLTILTFRQWAVGVFTRG